jgi:hypothetical protein
MLSIKAPKPGEIAEETMELFELGILLESRPT